MPPTDPPPRADNFDALRIAAAGAVMLSHGYTLSGRGDEPLFALSGGRASIGDAAVLTFFAVSGHLIAGSYLRRAEPVAFVRARALRLLPGLAAVLVLTAFALGPAVSRLPLGAYLSERSPYGYVVLNLALQPRYRLPGVFEGLPYPGAVNGSLWTLGPEVACYAAVLALGASGALRRPALLAAVAGLALAGSLGHGPRLGVVDFATAFAAGSLTRLWPALLGGPALAGAGLAVLAFALGGAPFALLDVAGALLVVGLGASRRVRLPRLAGRGDVSYGVYIWAFPMQQLAELVLRGAGGPAANLALAGPTTLALAYASWHLVERPCLRLKGPPRRGAPQYPPSGPTALESQPTVPSRQL